MFHSGRWLYLPIETWVREFHSKTLLAVQAASKGWSVIIGPKTAMNRRIIKFPAGTVFQFGLHKNFAPAMARLRAAGHKVVAVDEEGLVTLSPEHYRRYRVSPEAISTCNACFCWGEVQRDMIKGVDTDVQCELIVTGNPRMDLLRPEFRDLVENEAEHLRHKYGRFILLNGNFGSYNHAMGIDYTWHALESKGWMTTSADADFHRRRVELQGRFFRAFIKAIPNVCAAGHKVIIRPHPSESITPWVQLAHQYPGQVLVTREGNIVPWLHAARVVLHNGCTTAVEAVLLGRPVVSFRPECCQELESELPNRISLEAKSEHELLALIEDAEAHEAITRQSRLSYAQPFITGMTGPMACERMIEGLPVANTEGQIRKIHGLSATIDQWSASTKGLISRLLGRQNAGRYVDLKCSDLDLDVTAATVEDYARRLRIQYPLHVKSIGNGLMRICA